jgi:hypothetical protein
MLMFVGSKVISSEKIGQFILEHLVRCCDYDSVGPIVSYQLASRWLFPPLRIVPPPVCTLFNLLKPTGYGMHQQVEHFNSCMLCPYCVYFFCVCLRINSNLCHLEHKLIGFYNRDEKCLLCCMDWAFK